MNISLSAEQQNLQSEAVHLGQSLEGNLRERDRVGRFSRDDWNRCGDFGILASHLPVEMGGAGRDTVSTVAALEGLGYGCRDNGLSLALGGQIWSVQEPILIYGSEEQKQRYLPQLARGEWIGAHGVSEETSGSDALSMRSTATKVQGGYLLNGHKRYVGMAPLADLALVFANSDPEAGKWGVSAFLVEKSFEGFSSSEPREKTGTRTNPLGDLVLKDCFVPEENRLGEEGVGLSMFTNTIQWERAFIHAGHLGAMQRLMELTLTFSKERQQFGKPIGQFQSVSNRLANMRLRQETARLLLYKVAALKDQGHSASLECAMAKLHIAEALLESATDAVRIHGARGILDEFEVERELRDSIGGVIYAGTSDIQRNLIYELMEAEL